MKTTAKPAGPVHFDKVTRRIAELVDPYREICDLTDSEFPVGDEDQHGEFIAESFNVHHETGLTPREILAQRDGLLKAITEAVHITKGTTLGTPLSAVKSILETAIKNATAKGGEG